MKYNEYKDSGISWIGAIPSHWTVQRGKNILTLLERPIKDTDEVITCFRDGEVTLRKNRREEGFTFSLQEIGYQGIEPGDLVVHGMDGFAGAIGVSDSRGKATPVLNVMNSPHNKRYLMYYLRAAAYKDVFMSLSTGIRVRSCDLRWNKLSVFPFVLPNCSEQNQIVEYIDNKLFQIDIIIKEAKACIEEYKTWKESTIHEAVTKGLNSKVKLKESGVEWIGKMPQNWTRTKISNCFKTIGSGTTPSSDCDTYYTGEINWLQSGDINGGKVYTTKKKVTNEALASFSALRIYKAPFLVIAMYGASIANTSIVTIDACTNQACCVFCDMNELFNMDFIFYAVLAAKEELLLSARGGTQPNINQDILKKLMIPIPSKKEQEEIAQYLEKKCMAIQELIAEKEELIADLEAYKKSIIFEVVTGKRKVV